jgi:hypothetical protein
VEQKQEFVFFSIALHCVAAYHSFFDDGSFLMSSFSKHFAQFIRNKHIAIFISIKTRESTSISTYYEEA